MIIAEPDERPQHYRRPWRRELVAAVDRAHAEVDGQLSPYVDRELAGVTSRYVGGGLAAVTGQMILVVALPGMAPLTSFVFLTGAVAMLMEHRQRVGRLSVELWFKAQHANTAQEAAAKDAMELEEAKVIMAAERNITWLLLAQLASFSRSKWRHRRSA